MNPTVYAYDLLAIGALTAYAIGSYWRVIRWKPSPSNANALRWASTILLSIAWLAVIHAWAQVRPLPVLLRISRPMTESEKVTFQSKGISHDILDGINMTEHFKFNGENAPGFTWHDVRELKCRLAWHGLWPLFPKHLEISQDQYWPAQAFYRWRGLSQKQVDFDYSEGDWRIRSVRSVSACGIEPTNLTGRIHAWMPINFVD